MYSKETRHNVPIARNDLFYDNEAFEVDLDMGMDYLEHDANQTVVLYRVDIERSNLDALYSESAKDRIVYKTPVEIHCVYEIQEPELKAYDTKKNYGTYLKNGKLMVYVYDRHLSDLGVDIGVGDYVGVQVSESHMEYWVVSNDGRVNNDNSHTMYGTRKLWRTITCSPVDENEFRGV